MIEMKFCSAFSCLVLLCLIPRAARAQCDEFCTCIGDLADCSARIAFDFRFREIPVVPPTTTRLFLTNNEIANLSSGAFSHLPSLLELHLSYNQLSSLSVESFDSLPNLQRLVLDGNPLELTDGGAVFSSLTALQNLSIQSTSLVELSGSVLGGLSALTTLLLDNNQLVSLSTNFLEHVPSLTLLSLTGNLLDTLPDGFLDGAPLASLQLALQDNPWSCDCRLEWLPTSVTAYPNLIPTPEAECQWPPSLDSTSLSDLATSDLQCYAPSVVQQPQNDSILTDAPYTLDVVIDGAPFPEVVWKKDGKPVNYTDDVFVTGYDASLMFAIVTNSDGGVYSVTLTNSEDTVISDSITLSVTEATCVDGELTESHETDIDCGGLYCQPCSLGLDCIVDSDCAGDLVCLYSHQLPSRLQYISPEDPKAYTCANSTVPGALLESLLSAISTELSFAVAGNSSIQTIEQSFHAFITEALSIPPGALESVSVSVVEREISPLFRLEAEVVQDCEETVTSLKRDIDSGLLKATLKTEEGQGNICYNIRLNI